MRSNTRYCQLLCLLSSLLLSQCSHHKPSEHLQQQIQQDLLRQIQHQQPSPKSAIKDEPSASPAEMEFNGTLDTPTAIRLALFNNPDFRAELTKLGLSEAELVAAKTLPNPNFDGEVNFPIRGTDGSTGKELMLSFNLASLWEIPLKKQLASSAIQQEITHLQLQALQLATAVQAAMIDYWRYDALNKASESYHQFTKKTQALTERHYQAGLVNQLVLFHSQDEAAQAHLQTHQYREQRRQQSNQLRALLGLAPTQKIHPAGSLPMQIKVKPYTETESALAVSAHPAMRQLQQQLVGARLRLKQAKITRFGDIDVGVKYVRGLDKDNELGPTLSMGLPLFNRNQAEIKSAKAMILLTQQQLTAKEAELRHALRDKLDSMQAKYLQILHIENDILPNLANATQFAEQQQQQMTLSGLPLYEWRQKQVKTKCQQIELTADYYQLLNQFYELIGEFKWLV